MSEELLSVDDKGRIQVPKRLRKRLGLGRTVRARISDSRLMIEPTEDPIEELADQVEFTFTSIVEELPSLRRASKEQLAKETMA